MECVREPPEWFLWVWHSGPASDQFVASIRLFKVGEERDVGAEERWVRVTRHVSRRVTCHVFRSWTGGVIPMRIGKEDITSGRSLGFALHDRQVQPLCGVIQVGEATYSIELQTNLREV